jgi:acyl transferase domain-containing protein
VTEGHVVPSAPQAIAVVGIAGRFPGAADVDALWANLRDGVESIARFDEDDLRSEGLNPTVLDAPDHVPAGGALDGVELFDADFFGFNPREAEVLDVQHRVFLECCWEALERAGHAPSRFDGAIGIYAGAGASSQLHRLLADHETVRLLGTLQLTIANEKDHLTTRVAYKLGLRGPAITVQTTCSSSLVAVCLACQSLGARQCDLALAGGVSIVLPQRVGYRYRQGGILSPDGHCRAFDAAAAGAVGGNGAGVVVLRRLADAVADGDHVHAVLRGTALNNDGSLKVGYTAPSIDGQAAVIRRALASAGLEPADISYVEAHGTGTPLGDPVEVAALTEAFGGHRPAAVKTCAIGSLKTNLGHLDAAAGIAGLIKVVLALENEELPASLHFRTPNPELRLDETPFTVVAQRTPWSRGEVPRRAGVSSFGIGGTNAHVVVEEAPPLFAAERARPWHLLPVSGRSAAVVERAAANLADRLELRPAVRLEDVAFTLQAGRESFRHRAAIVADDLSGAVAALRDGGRAPRARDAGDGVSVAFLFPGQGAQWPGMARELHASEPAFRETLDAGCEVVGGPLRELLLGESTPEVGAALRRTALAQPSLLVTGLALADLWASWGVRPAAMIGHSVGELAVACLAGVFRREDALRLAVERGRVMEAMAPGGMLAVGLGEAAVRALLVDGVEIAAVNAPALCTVSGPLEALAALERELAARGVATSRLHVSHAFHSAAMAEAADAFARAVAEVERRAPAIPYVANLTGDWVTDELAADPAAWGRQLREPVRFAEGARALLATGSALLEVGPGNTLGTIARASASPAEEPIVVASLPGAGATEPAERVLTEAVGRLWVAGAGVDLPTYARSRPARRTALPTYPFERSRYWLETQPRTRRRGPALAADGHGVRRPRAEWLSVPSWRRGPPLPARGREGPHSLLLIAGDAAAGAPLANALRRRGVEVALPTPIIDPSALLDAVRGVHGAYMAVYLASSAGGVTAAFDRALGIVRALAVAPTTRRIVLVTDCAADVTGVEKVRPEQAALHGLVRVLAQEHPGLDCRTVDVDLHVDGAFEPLARELVTGAGERSVALRGDHRWLPGFERLAAPEPSETLLRHRGTYLITGGLGRIGLTLATRLAHTVEARLVLVSRTELPPRAAWGEAAAGGGRVAVVVRALAEIERAGGELLIAAADVSDRDRMAAVLAETERRFGNLDGVVHAAGAVGSEAFAPLVELDDAVVRNNFAPKVDGTLVLDELLRGQPPALAVLVSSISAVLGGLGFGAYAAANAFLDAFASGPGRGRWTSVAWEGWRFASAGSNGGLGALALTPEEGADMFERIAALPRLPHVLVSTGDLDARVRSWVELESLRAKGDPPETRRAVNVSLAGHPRPALDTDYAAPVTEAERRIAAAWEELLGIATVGVHDDFFALGGHSLLAIQLISRLREAFGVELSVHVLFDCPTVAEQAAQVEAARAAAAPGEDGRLAELLDLVESLSDEEVEALLAEEEAERRG